MENREEIIRKYDETLGETRIHQNGQSQKVILKVLLDIRDLLNKTK